MRLFFVLLCVFIALPWLELYILLRINVAFGLANTLGLIILTGVVGAALARWQGFQVITRVQDALRQGTVPALDLLDGLLIMCAALVLVTPGLITDTVGFLLLIPPARHVIRTALLRGLKKRFVTHTRVDLSGQRTQQAREDDKDVIEVTARDVPDDDR